MIMGKYLIIPGADFSANKVLSDKLYVKTRNNVPFYLYYGANVVDEGAGVVSGIDGVLEINSYIDVTELEGLGNICFCTSTVYNPVSEQSDSVYLYNADKTVNYAVLYPNLEDTLLEIEFPDMDIENALRLVTGSRSLTSVNFNSLDVSECDTIQYIASACSNLQSVILPKREGNKPFSARGLFYDDISLSSMDDTNFGTHGMNSLRQAFRGTAFRTLDLSNWDFSNVIDVNGIFRNCVNLESVTLPNFSTSEQVDLSGMFYKCSSIKSVDLSNWSLKAKNPVVEMFTNCSSIESIILGNFDLLNNVKDLFKGLIALETVDISGIDLSVCTTVQNMFYGCSNLESINIGNCDLGNVSNYSDWFSQCPKISTITGTISNLGKSATNGIGLGRYSKWNHDSLMVFINGLYDRTGLTQYSLGMTAEEKALLSPSDIQIATNKNWDIIEYS